MPIEISALVPVYNEEDRIEKTIETIKNSRYIREVIVVDDGSQDSTAVKASNAGAKVIKLDKNMGKGYALKYGLDRMIDENEIIIFLDGDLDASHNDIDRLIEPVIQGDCDVSIAKFLQSKKKGGFGLVKLLAKKGIEFYTRQNIDSGLSGQRAFRTEVLRNFKKMPSRYGVEVGMTIDILKSGYSIKEIEVSMGHRETGRDLNGFIHRGKQFYQILWTLILKGFR
ncbi:glycosyltransferase family 2 protein [Wukongibacter baidiensis]|uniref:glycosyltransferase family 2 protein n=1 Tax=Wukongibacter baidiensis TaxID=1723361 RepID=UPI003D7F364A